MLTDTEALLAAIVANPEEDMPRLCYADEIECSDPERAEFIRLSITLTLHGVNRRDMGQWGSEAGRVAYLRSRNERKWMGSEKCRACRGEGFFGHEYESPIQPICEDCHGTGFACWPLAQQNPPMNHGQEFRITATFSRGFLHRVEMPCGAFVKHAGLIFKWHPTIQQVEITDKRPIDLTFGRLIPNQWGWGQEEFPRDISNCLPRELFELIRKENPLALKRAGSGWESATHAKSDLSRACVRFGHSQTALLLPD